MSHPLTDQGDTPFIRDMADAGRAVMSHESLFGPHLLWHGLADLEPHSTIVTFDDGKAARLLERFRLDGTDYMVAAVEGGMAEVNLTTGANRFVATPYCSVCYAEKRWPSHLDAAGRCKECQP